MRADKEGTGIGTVTIGEGAAIDFSGSSGDVTIYYNPAGYNQDETKTVQDTNGVLLGPYNDRVTMGSGSFTSYMLVNSLEDLDNVRTEPSGVYALGHDIDASATGVKDSAFWNDGAGFMPIGDFRGIFNGNGHTIDRLYINRTDLWSVGLFASAGNGVWIKDVGLTNVDITGDGRVGALAGRLVSGFRVDRSYATGVVEGGTIVGGLAGAAGNGGTISESYAAVTVTGTGHRVGGLVGSMGYFASIFYSYATGNVTGSGYQVGGLLGYAVDYARIYTSYASGAVRAAGDVGGLVGYIDHTSSIHNSYWDVEKTGVSDAVGSGWVLDVDATGVGGEGRPDPLSEATYKSFEDAGLDFTAHFGIIDGISYPYLRWRFPQGPSVVSGTVSGVENGNDRLGVGLAVGGNLIGTTTTGADGSYYMAVDPLNAGDAAIVWLDDANARGNTFSFVNYEGHGTGLDIFSDVVHVMTNVKTMSATSTNLMDAARGALPNENGRFLYSVSGGALEISPGISLNVWAPVGQFDIDQAISTSEGGSMTVEGESGNLTVSKNLHADGTVTLMAHSHLTISKGVTVTSAADGNAIVIAAEISFRNNSGSNALVLTGDGRWLVYSGVVSQNTYGGLDSGNTAVWNASYATRPPSTVNLPGNRYLFKQQPTLYFYLPTDLEKTYGEAIDPSTLHAAYSVSGFHEGREGAFLADTAATAFSGAPKWSSEGFAADANVDDYQVLIEAGNLYSEAGYDLEFSSGYIIVNPASITISATPITKTYDGTPDSNEKPEVTAGQLFFGDLLYAKQEFDSKHAGARILKVTEYLIDDGNGGNNYEVTLVEGNGTINPKALTVGLIGTVHKTYDGTTHAALTTDNYDLIGALTTDEVELSAPGFGTYDTENAGENKTVSVSGLDLVGRDAANYVLDQDSVSAAIGVITRAELVVRALDFAKLAGEKNPAFDVSYEGFVAGDTAEGLAGDLSFATDAATDSPPGRYAITPFGLSAPNYTITYEPGTLTIAATPIVSGAPEDAYEMAVWYAQTVLQTDLETDEADEDDVLELLE